MGWMKDETGLDKCAANFVPLTPLSHLRRAVQIYPDYEALVYGETRRSYREYHARVTQLASALKNLGLRPRRCGGDAAAQYPRPCRGAFRRARQRRGAQRDQHAARA